jgi:hypothetical protein
LSLAYPVHRYRCRSFICNWEGNLLYDTQVPDPGDAAPLRSPNRALPQGPSPRTQQRSGTAT